MAKEDADPVNLETFVLSVTTGPLETLLALIAIGRIRTAMNGPKTAFPLQKLKS